MKSMDRNCSVQTRDRFLQTGAHGRENCHPGLSAPITLLSRSGRRSSGNERRGPDSVELWKTLFQILAPSGADQALVRTVAVRRALAVPVVQLIHNFHTVRDHSERRKSATIEGLVVAVINEKLRRSCVRPRCCKRDEPAVIALHDGIVLNGCGFPDFGDLGIGAESKLRHESGQNTEEGRAIVEMVSD